MPKITPISGFPEWLPQEKLIEQSFIDTLRKQFELFGFSPIEPRSIEPLDILLSKGDDKEIYTLRRLHEDDSAAPARFGLHFDMTVPFARYVQQFRGQLQFPFKRYQIQKAWRGERPQEGRYREFYQADIDVINEGELAISYDAEFPQLIHEVMTKLPVPDVTIRVNNRKVLTGFYSALGIEDVAATLRTVDKLDKIGADGVRASLETELGLKSEHADKCLDLASIRTVNDAFVNKVRELGYQHELLDEGLEELAFVMNASKDLPEGKVIADLSIARGLDYYTGTVYETQFVGHESLGAVCSGGRYDNLASGEKVKLPGVGISFGLTRMLGYLFGREMLKTSKTTPVLVLVALPSEESRLEAVKLTQQLRRRGIPADTYHAAQKFGKQIRAAERRGIPYVLFFEPGQTKYDIKDIRSGEQFAVDLASWTPPQEDFETSTELVT